MGKTKKRMLQRSRMLAALLAAGLALSQGAFWNMPARALAGDSSYVVESGKEFDDTGVRPATYVYDTVDSDLDGKADYCSITQIKASFDEVQEPPYIDTGKNSFNIPSEIEALPVKVLKKDGQSLFYDESTNSIADTVNVLTLPEGLETIGEDTFAGITFNTRVQLPSSLKMIGESAFEKAVFKSQLIFNGGEFRISSKAFFQATFNKTMVFPEGAVLAGNEIFGMTVFKDSVSFLGSGSIIPARSFCGARFDEDLTFSGNYTELGRESFLNCGLLGNVQLPEGLKTIGDSALYGITLRNDLYIPSSVTKAAENAFYFYFQTPGTEYLICAHTPVLLQTELGNRKPNTMYVKSLCTDDHGTNHMVVYREATDADGETLQRKKCEVCGYEEGDIIYAVTFDSDGGTEVAEEDAVPNGTVAEPAVPEKEGYEFQGWLLGDTTYDFASPVTADIELKASWKEKEAEKEEGSETKDPGTGEETGTGTDERGTDEGNEGGTGTPTDDGSDSNGGSGEPVPQTGEENAGTGEEAGTGTEDGWIEEVGSPFINLDDGDACKAPGTVLKSDSYTDDAGNVISYDVLDSDGDGQGDGINISNIDVINGSQDVDGADLIFPNTITELPVVSICKGDKDLVTGLTYGREVTNIKTLSLPSGITVIGEEAFKELSFKGNVSIPESVSVIGTSAFENSVFYENIAFPAGQVKLLSRAFAGAYFYNSLHLPANLQYVGGEIFDQTHFDDKVSFLTNQREVPYGLFYESWFSKGLELSENITKISPYAFKEAKFQTPFQLPEGVEEISMGAFYYAQCDEGITLPDTLKTIGSHAFECFESQKDITIPVAVTSIGNKAFYVTNNLYKAKVQAHKNADGFKENLKDFMAEGQFVDLCEEHMEETAEGAKKCAVCGYVEKEEEAGTGESGKGEGTGTGTETGTGESSEGETGTPTDDGADHNGGDGEPVTPIKSDYSRMKVEQAGTGFSMFTTDKVIDGKNNMAFGFYPPEGDQGVTLKAIITGITEEQRAKLHYFWMCLETVEEIETSEPEFVLTRAQLLENATDIQQRNFMLLIQADDAEGTLYSGSYSVNPMPEGENSTPPSTEEFDSAPNGDGSIEPKDNPSGTEDRGQGEKPGQEPEGQGEGSKPVNGDPLAPGSGDDGNNGGEGAGTKKPGTGDGTGTEAPGTSQETGTGDGQEGETGTSPEARVPVSPSGTKPAGQEERSHSDPIVTPRDTGDKPKPGKQDIAKNDQDLSGQGGSSSVPPEKVGTEEQSPSPSDDEEHLPWPVVPVAAAATAGAGTVLLVVFWWRRRIVRGLVVDKKGRPQQGIYFTLEGPDELEAVTNVGGSIIFKNLKKGTYAMTVYNRKDEAILVATVATDMPKEEAVEIMQSSVKGFDFEKRGRRTVFKVVI